MEKELTKKEKTVENIRKTGGALERIASVALLLLCAVIFTGLTFYCARYTWLEQDGIPYEIRDSAVKNLGIGILPALGMFLLYRLAEHRKIRPVVAHIRKGLPYLVAVVTIGIYMLSALWVSQCHIAPSGDGLSLCQAAFRMINGYYVDLQEPGYLFIFPHQLGLYSVIHGIYALTGGEHYQIFQQINAACIPLLFYSGYRILRLLYDRLGAILAYILLFVTCLPLIFYIPYVYGEVISITFTMVFMWQVLRFCKTGKKSSFIFGTIAILIACYVRSNSLIVLIAGGIVLCIHSLKEAKIRGALWLLVMALLVSGSGQLIRAYYANLSGIEISDGAPFISWVRMGLQDSPLGPGWFDNSSVEAYAEHDYNTEETANAEKEKLREQLAVLWADKSCSIDFFRRKILSQWNAPGYHYTYATEMFDCEPSELPDFVRKLYFDNAEAVQAFLNHYQFVIYFYTMLLIFLLLADRKRRCLPELILYIAITGGFLFTLLWESGSRYVLPYLIYMLPLAAVAMCRLVKKSA